MLPDVEQIEPMKGGEVTHLHSGELCLDSL